jgi:hypothetical protein
MAASFFESRMIDPFSARKYARFFDHFKARRARNQPAAYGRRSSPGTSSTSKSVQFE